MDQSGGDITSGGAGIHMILCLSACVRGRKECNSLSHCLTFDMLRSILVTLPIRTYQSYCATPGVGCFWHYRLGYDGFVVDQFINFMFVETGDWHEDSDIAERLDEYDFYVRRGVDEPHIYRKDWDPQLSEMVAMETKIKEEASKEDQNDILSVVLAYKQKIDKEEHEAEECRARAKAARAAAREEAKNFRKFKSAFGCSKKRKKSARYSMRK